MAAQAIYGYSNELLPLLGTLSPGSATLDLPLLIPQVWLSCQHLREAP